MDSFLAFTILVSAGSLVVLALILFAEYRKLDELESYFSENKAVQRNKRFWGRNKRIDRTMRMSIFIGFFMQPKTHIKSNEVTREELDSVPLALKRWATWPFYFSVIYFMALTTWVVWRKW